MRKVQIGKNITFCKKLSTANVHSTKLRFVFKQQKILATARQTKELDLEICMIKQFNYQ